MSGQPKLMEVVDHRHKIIYFTTPKAACTSIRKALDLSDRDHNKSTNGYYLISSVRNPWDRIVSLFFEYKLRLPWVRFNGQITSRFAKVVHLRRDLDISLDCEWPEFVVAIAKSNDYRNIHYRSQYLFHPPKLDALLRFERLQVDWQALRDRFPDLPLLGTQNRTAHKPYEEYYDRDLAALIGERYKEDIKRYNYVSPCPD